VLAGGAATADSGNVDLAGCDGTAALLLLPLAMLLVLVLPLLLLEVMVVLALLLSLLPTPRCCEAGLHHRHH
jgi:hypothetical protein